MTEPEVVPDGRYHWSIRIRGCTIKLLFGDKRCISAAADFFSFLNRFWPAEDLAPAAKGRPLLFLPEERSVHTHVAAGLRLTPPREQMGSSGCIANRLSDSTRAMLIGHGHGRR